MINLNKQNELLFRSMKETTQNLKHTPRYASQSIGLLLLFSCSVVSNSLQPHGLQHTRLPCPSPSPEACLDSCPLSSSNRLILCHPLLLLPSILPSIRIFSNESGLPIRWPKYWSFSFSICPSNEYSGLISFMMDWLDLLAVQGTFKSVLQHHSSNHQFFIARLFLQSNTHIHT